MKKVIILVGLPGSGKSTWAKKLISQNPNQYKRVNKDELRLMLDNGKWSRDSEKLVLALRDTIILQALENGKHVIVDDTNLAPRHKARIEQLVKGKATVAVQDFTGASLEYCIKQDLLRTASVGEQVIRRMYNQFLKPEPEVIEYDPELPSAIICDLDGTLSLLNGRDPYDASTCDQDGLNKVVANLIKGRKVVLLSGREDKFIDQTRRFLKKHEVDWNLLYMRQTGDNRKDAIVKREFFDQHIRGKYNIEFVLDDRNQVVEMWRSLGLTCLQVAEGDF